MHLWNPRPRISLAVTGRSGRLRDSLRGCFPLTVKLLCCFFLGAASMSPLVAADGALRAGLRPVMMPQAYHTHLRTLLRRPET